MKEIMVTVYCLAYNHEKYIRETLEGFVNQKTNFKYEVIVHDDASTDNTANIIKQYEKKYPGIIKGLYQTENQYSKGIGIVNTYILPNIKGKYIAVCEGDDYWIDTFKLQKQFDYLEKHPNCTFCFTNANIENQINKEIKKFIPYSAEEAKYFLNTDRDYTLKNFYEIEFAPTASYMYPASNIKKEPKSFKKICPANDLKKRLYYTAMGYAHYINDVTCVYRENVSNSATTLWKGQYKKKRYEVEKKIIEMIDDVDVFTNYEYSEDLAKLKEKYILLLIGAASNYKVLKNETFYNVFKKQKFIKKIEIIIRIFLPESILKLLKKIKIELSKI